MEKKDEVPISVDVWFQGKLMEALLEVAAATEYARELESLETPELKNHELSAEMQKKEMLINSVLDSQYGALFDLTKCAAKLAGFDGWEPGDSDEIYENGKLGLANVLEKYGLSGWYGGDRLGDRERVDIRAKFKQILELSQSPERSNRTLIYDELRGAKRHPLTRILLDAIEPVSQGEKSWTEFQREAKEILKDFQSDAE